MNPIVVFLYLNRVLAYLSFEQVKREYARRNRRHRYQSGSRDVGQYDPKRSGREAQYCSDDRNYH